MSALVNFYNLIRTVVTFMHEVSVTGPAPDFDDQVILVPHVVSSHFFHLHPGSQNAATTIINHHIMSEKVLCMLETIADVSCFITGNVKSTGFLCAIDPHQDPAKTTRTVADFSIIVESSSSV